MSLLTTHTLCLCSHTPTTKHACLLLVLRWLESDRTKSLFWVETFLRESVRLCQPQEGSPRHADPTGDRQRAPPRLSQYCLTLPLVFISLARVLVVLHNTHISAAHQKTSGSADDVLQTGAGGRRVQGAVCGLLVPVSL